MELAVYCEIVIIIVSAIDVFHWSLRRLYSIQRGQRQGVRLVSAAALSTYSVGAWTGSAARKTRSASFPTLTRQRGRCSDGCTTHLGRRKSLTAALTEVLRLPMSIGIENCTVAVGFTFTLPPRSPAGGLYDPITWFARRSAGQACARLIWATVWRHGTKCGPPPYTRSRHSLQNSPKYESTRPQLAKHLA